MNGLSFHESVGGIQDINFTNAVKQSDTIADLDKVYGRGHLSVSSMGGSKLGPVA